MSDIFDLHVVSDSSDKSTLQPSLEGVIYRLQGRILKRNKATLQTNEMKDSPKSTFQDGDLCCVHYETCHNYEYSQNMFSDGDLFIVLSKILNIQIILNILKKYIFRW